MLETFPEDVKIVFKNFPIRSHRFATRAATAAIAAHSYGKFWEYHDLLFENYNKLDNNLIYDIARKLGFDKEEFKKRLNDPKLREIIKKDVADGRQAGVKSVPAVFINGRFIKNRSLENFKKIISEDLKN